MATKRSNATPCPVGLTLDTLTHLDGSEEKTMKAIVQHVYGEAEVLDLADIAIPEIADDQVLIRVHAAGVDRGCGIS